MEKKVASTAAKPASVEGPVSAVAQSASGIKIIADNRKARHDYFLSDFIEAGVALTGTEVKAARGGKVQLRDGYAEVQGNEAWLLNVHIGHYTHGNIANHEIRRRRKLLLHRREIDKLAGKTREKGVTLIPTKVYFKGGKIKCEIAIGRGKREYDKRETIRNRERDLEARAALRRYNK